MFTLGCMCAFVVACVRNCTREKRVRRHQKSERARRRESEWRKTEDARDGVGKQRRQARIDEAETQKARGTNAQQEGSALSSTIADMRSARTSCCAAECACCVRAPIKRARQRTHCCCMRCARRPTGPAAGPRALASIIE
eukprot:3241624-Pleurochrysis_carterae.AAC.1